MTCKFTSIESIEINDTSFLDGNFTCKTNTLINELCKKIEQICATIYFTNFSLFIKKNKKKLKIKINTNGISKELIYFLNYLPQELDVLIIPQLILKETLNNLPINLKKLLIENFTTHDFLTFDELKKANLPHNIKIYIKN